MIKEFLNPKLRSFWAEHKNNEDDGGGLVSDFFV